DWSVTGVQTCALPICGGRLSRDCRQQNEQPRHTASVASSPRALADARLRDDRLERTRQSQYAIVASTSSVGSEYTTGDRSAAGRDRKSAGEGKSGDGE